MIRLVLNSRIVCGHCLWRYTCLHRLQNVKRPETRARKIGEYVEMLARGETIHPRRAVR